jgi:hypothetical protein
MFATALVAGPSFVSPEYVTTIVCVPAGLSTTPEIDATPLAIVPVPSVIPVPVSRNVTVPVAAAGVTAADSVVPEPSGTLEGFPETTTEEVATAITTVAGVVVLDPV